MAHQLVPGVLADRRGDLLACHRGQRVGAPRAVRAQAGLDGPEARHAGRLAQRREPARAEVDRVQGELNAARSSRLAPSRSGAGGDSAGSVAAYGSIASSAMRTCRARAATDAAARADLVGQRSLVFGRTIMTGRLVWCSRPVETLPSTAARSAERPRLPATITLASSSSASSMSAAKNGPDERHGARLGVEPGGAGQLGALGGQLLGGLAPRLVERRRALADHVAGQREQGGGSGALEGRPGGGDDGRDGAGARRRRARSPPWRSRIRRRRAARGLRSWPAGCHPRG